MIIQLCFEGVTGHGVAELVNLQRENVDFEKKQLSLTDDDGPERILKVSEDCLNLVKGALEQTRYYRRNGEVSDNIRMP